MTENELRLKVVETALAWKGTCTGDYRHQQLCDIYNSHKPLARGFRMDITQAWCSMFVSTVAIQLDLTDIIPTEIGVGKHIDLFKKMGIWVERDDYVPRPGDILVYDWKDDGKGENTDGASHIGYVIDVTKTSMEVIEGNKGDPGYVGTRPVDIDGRYIRGFAVPDYKSKCDGVPTPHTKVEVGSRVTIKAGAKWYNGKRIPNKVMKSRHTVDELVGDRAVLDIHTICSPIHVGDLVLAQAHNDDIVVDGIWGRKTTMAVQKKLGMPRVDGVLSNQYRGNVGYCIKKDSIDYAGWEFVSNVSAIGSSTVYALQMLIGVAGDGVVGPATIKALQKFLKIRRSGTLDRNTVKAVQKWCNG